LRLAGTEDRDTIRDFRRQTGGGKTRGQGIETMIPLDSTRGIRNLPLRCRYQRVVACSPRKQGHKYFNSPQGGASGISAWGDEAHGVDECTIGGLCRESPLRASLSQSAAVDHSFCGKTPSQRCASFHEPQPSWHNTCIAFYTLESMTVTS